MKLVTLPDHVKIPLALALKVISDMHPYGNSHE